MKIKYNTGFEYGFNFIQSAIGKIEYAEFVSDMAANRFNQELVIYFNVWMRLIEEHNAKC